MANYPTPTNIVSITYQLKQQVNDPASIRGQLPALTIQFIDDNSVVRNKVVTFREMLPYLQYLHSKALSLGKVIVCDPEATFDNKIVFIAGEPTGGQIQVVQVATAGNNPCATVPIVIYLDHAAPFVVGDILYTDAAATIPLLGFDLVANVDDGIIYGLDPLTGEVLAATGATCTVPPPVIEPFDVTFQLDGVNFDAAKNLTDANGSCTTLNAFTIRSTVNAFWVATFQLPFLGGADFREDYSLPFIPINTYINAIRVGNNWNCAITFAANPVNSNINITTNSNFITVQNINNGSGQSVELGMWTDTFDKVYSLGYVGSPNEKIRVPRAGVALNPQSYAQASLAGIWNVRQYDVNGLEIGFTSNVYSTSNVPFAVGVALITFEFKRLNFINDIVGSSNKIIISDSSVSGFGFAIIYDESNTSQYLRYPKGLPSSILGVATLDPALLPYNLSFYKNGVLLNTVAVNTQLQNCVPTDLFWDTLVFGTGTPPATGNLTVENQMGAAPGETTQIDSVNIDAFAPVVVAPAYPVLPLQTSNGTFTGAIASNIQVNISNTGVVPPTTVRVVDALGGVTDQPYTADGAYNFIGINTVGLVRVVLF